ncbi:MAG: hypothetical protein LBC68_08465 [Prevotellaceae bacterium]|nr:hypothetical protein [Prevotellaceae bacterium]
MEEETVWLTQTQMVMLFDCDRTVITKHINNIFKEGELEPKSNVHFLHIANSDKPVAFYNLDVIISVGYRVKTYQIAHLFRFLTFGKQHTNIEKCTEPQISYFARDINILRKL